MKYDIVEEFEKDGKLLALIDGDFLTYSCGFASDSSAKRWWDENVDSVPLITADFVEIDGRTAYCESLATEELKVLYWEPLDWCLNNVKKTITTIMEESGADDYVIFLTGKNNFRDKRATILPYKGNRDGAHKPHWYKEIREYLSVQHAAITVDGYEADDAQSIMQLNPPDDWDTVICGVDKDLLQVEGKHYNWKKKEKITVSQWQGEYNLAFQMLQGDTADNIAGIYKLSGGKQKFTKALKDMLGQHDLPLVGAMCVYEEVLGEEYADMWHENMDLLFMLREEPTDVEI